MRRIAQWTTGLVFVVGIAAGGQSVPLISAEWTAGNGAQTDHTETVRYYYRNNAGLTRLAAAIRLGSPGVFRPVLVVERHAVPSIDNPANGKADCVIHGGCANFPTLSGYATSLGLRRRLGSRLLLGTGIGIGFYERRAGFASVDGSFRVFPHVALVADARHIQWRAADGQALAYSPISFGIRGY